jgi:hypothetical protein
MNRTKKKALKAVGFFVGAILAATTLRATAANLVAHYPLDSCYYQGGGSSGVPYTPNTAPGSTWGDARLNYSGQLLYGGYFTNAIFDNGFMETNSNGGMIVFGTLDPFAATGSFTYALWVWDPFSTTPNLQTMLLSKQQANTDHYFRIILRSGNASTNQDDMQISAYSGTTGSGTLQQRNTSAFTNVVSDPSLRWVHIAVTGSKSGDTATWQVYADGKQVPFSANTTLLDATRAGIAMTCGVTAGNQAQAYPNLIVDDIRFYDGVLTAEEIQAIPGVTPVSASIGVTSGVVTVSWNSFVGNRYQLRKTTDLSSLGWAGVGTPVTATATTTSVSEAQGADPTYYRVEVLP